MWRMLMLGLLLVAGCGQNAIPPAVPDVDATVTARVQATMASVPTPLATIAPPRDAATLPPAPTKQTVAPLVVPDPITVTGQLDAQSAPFTLLDGAYVISWKITSQPVTGSCYGRLVLASVTDPQYNGPIATGFDSKISPSGVTQFYRIVAGQYYVGSTSSCPGWSVTFTKT